LLSPSPGMWRATPGCGDCVKSVLWSCGKPLPLRTQRPPSTRRTVLKGPPSIRRIGDVGRSGEHRRLVRGYPVWVFCPRDIHPRHITFCSGLVREGTKPPRRSHRRTMVAQRRTSRHPAHRYGSNRDGTRVPQRDFWPWVRLHASVAACFSFSVEVHHGIRSSRIAAGTT
jgi:hypothetical protein